MYEKKTFLFNNLVTLCLQFFFRLIVGRVLVGTMANFLWEPNRFVQFCLLGMHLRVSSGTYEVMESVCAS